MDYQYAAQNDVTGIIVYMQSLDNDYGMSDPADIIIYDENAKSIIDQDVIDISGHGNNWNDIFAWVLQNPTVQINASGSWHEIDADAVIEELEDNGLY